MKLFMFIGPVGILCAASALGGCASSEDVVVAAPIPGGGIVGTGDLNGQNQAGQQWTIQDTGSGPGIGDGRAKMNEAAAGQYTQGLQAFRAGDLPGAKRLFTAATQADSQAFQAFYSLGVVQERLKDENATSSYRQAYTLASDYEPAIVAFALLKAKKGSLSEADTFLSKKRTELPKSAAVLTALAEVKSLQKDSGTAQNLASEALKINPDYKPAMLAVARDYYRARKIDLALYALQAILDGFDTDNPPRDKENAEAMLLRGLIFKEQGNPSQAIEQFEQALKRRPDLVEARVQLATFYLKAGNAEQALPIVEGALRFDADNTAAHLLLGDCFRLQGKVAEAKQRFDFVLGRDASLYQAHYNLGLLYLTSPSVPGLTPMQQVDAATSSFKKFQELRPKDVSDDSDELLNRARLKRGELEAAEKAAQPPPPAPPADPPATPATPDAAAPKTP